MPSAQSRSSLTRPCIAATSSRVPPRDTGQPCSAQMRTRAGSAGSTYPMPQPTFTMSTRCAAWPRKARVACWREPLVQDVRDPGRARLGRARRQSSRKVGQSGTLRLR